MSEAAAARGGTGPARAPAAGRARLATALLVALALLFPVGALVQPWLLPSRSAMPAVPRQLNQPVVLITVAGLRADRLHHLGFPRPITPALDRIAEDGVSFVTFYSSSNDALETAAALMAARCPEQTGIASGRLPPATETLAERALSARYATAAVLANPELVGRGLEQGFQHVRVLAGPGGGGAGGAAPARASAAEAFAAAEALMPTLGDRFLLWIDLGDLLAPYGGPDLDLSAFAPDAPAGFGAEPSDYDLEPADLAARGWGGRELAWMAARYEAALAALDAAVGRFVDGLAARNRLHTMTLCLTGLRGERLDERPGRAFTHGVDLYEPSLRVPFLVQLPAKFVRGLRLDRLGQTVDIGPTLADLGLRQAWPGTGGRSLDVAIRFQQAPNRVIFAQGRVQPRRDGPSWEGCVLRLASHKLITDAALARKEVYLLPGDALERSPVALQPMQLEALASHGRDWLEGCAPR